MCDIVVSMYVVNLICSRKG